MKNIIILLILVLSMIALSAFARIEEKDILGIWTMDEGKDNIVKDLSGKGNDGEIFGKVNWVNGKDGKAIEFAGGNVQVPHKEELNLQTFTMMCWLNVPKVVQPYQMVMGKEAWPNRNYSMWLLPEKANVGITSPADQQVQSAAVVVDGKWHHVAATYDMKALKLLVDGEVSAQSNINSKPLTCEAPFMIGAQPPAGGGGINGTMDEVSLFNVGLSDDDIKGIFDNGIKQYVLAIEAKGKLATTWANLRK